MAWLRLLLQGLVELLVLPVTVLRLAGLWDPLYKRFFPHLMCHFVADINRRMARVKRELFDELAAFAASPAAALRVLEVGCGTGANFPFYPRGCRVTCLDSNPNFEAFLRRSVADSGHVELDSFVVGSAEDLRQVASGSMDAVVCTLVLCSVHRTDLVLSETLRVLRPGGAFFFIEHVAAAKTKWLHFFQHVFQPAWRYFGDGCRLTCDTEANLEKAKFSKLNLKYFTEPMAFKLINDHVVGYGVK
ncbi:thiol S-methyltransferase TMT1A-like [Rhinoraja longicauda]